MTIFKISLLVFFGIALIYWTGLQYTCCLWRQITWERDFEAALHSNGRVELISLSPFPVKEIFLLQAFDASDNELSAVLFPKPGYFEGLPYMRSGEYWSVVYPRAGGNAFAVAVSTQDWCLARGLPRKIPASRANFFVSNNAFNECAKRCRACLAQE